jgi:transaldolase
MENESYLQWLVRETPTTWWHDSADPGELRHGLEHGASGVTTNPLLSAQTLYGNPAVWADKVRALPAKLASAEKAEELIKIVAGYAASQVCPSYNPQGGPQGYACAQVNPSKAGDREAMLGMARRYHAVAPNISVKLPANAAGLDVLEECAAEGITTTLTVSFSVPQVLAIADRYERGLAQARAAGTATAQCTSVIMLGRLDDYLRDIVADRQDKVTESDIKQAGLAVVKRAYAAYQQMGTQATLLIAALRGTHHMTGLAGAKMIMSIHPKIQALLLQPGVSREEGIAVPVSSDAIARLNTVPEFRRAYEPDGMKPEEFMSWGLTQRTLTQFVESGWNLLEAYKLA